MANTTVNKVILGNETLLDLTGDTVTAANLAQGVTAHDASGAAIVGTFDKASGSVYQDADGYLVVDDNKSSAPQGNLSITANGTYDVSDYAGASVDIPVGMTKTELKSFISRGSLFTDIDWPEGLTVIGSYAFAYCYYFNPASLPSGVTSIGEYAFFNCSQLAWTSLPSGLETIGQYAFRSCNKLALTSLPSSVTSIDTAAFQRCSSLELTALPSGITSLDSSVFSGCTSLVSMALSGVTVIGSNAFKDCTSLATVTLSSGLTKIDAYSFSGCTALNVSALPDSLTYIGNSAFNNCISITSISCSGAVTTLGSSAFLGNSSHAMQLASASFPNMAIASNLTTAFGNNTAVYACQLLEFCDIGSTTGIGSSAFANCYALETLVLRKSDSICTLANVNAFTNTPMSGYNNLTGTIYVPQALISTYQTATNWSTLYDAGTVTFAAIEGSEYER